MNQRINIQYSITMEELEGEVSRLIERAYARMGSLPALEGPALSMETISQIEKTRSELAQIDYCLNDVSKIVGGYLSYRVREMEEPSDSRVSDDFTEEDEEILQHDPVISAPTEADLHDAIEAFKNSIPSQ